MSTSDMQNALQEAGVVTIEALEERIQRAAAQMQADSQLAARARADYFSAIQQ